MSYTITNDGDLLQVRATLGSRAEMLLFVAALQQRKFELPTIEAGGSGEQNGPGDSQPISSDVPANPSIAAASPGGIDPESDPPPANTRAFQEWSQKQGQREIDPLGADHPPSKGSIQEG